MHATTKGIVVYAMMCRQNCNCCQFYMGWN